MTGSALTRLEQEIHVAYGARTSASRAWHERACKSLVGGVSGTVRYFRPYPLYFQHGQGAHTTDLDGNDYVDCFLCGACLLLGHRAPEIMAAIAETFGAGSLVLNPTLSTELAESIQALVPGAERVRLLNSGTEAVMSALRFARAFTGRPKIIKFAGTYHGQADEMLTGLDDRPGRVGAGVTAASVSELIVARLGDLDGLLKLLAQADVAAILLDPTMHHCGLWAGGSVLYQTMKEMAHAAGSLLIFDEVISGFRIAVGGAQEYFGVTPDLAVFGKALGAGERIGAVTGRADVMAVADPARRIRGPFAFQSGTGNDSRNAVASAHAALATYAKFGRDSRYEAISVLAARLAAGLRLAFTERGIACHTNQLGPMVRLFLTAGPATPEHCGMLDPKPVNLFHLALVTEGVLTIPGSNDFFLSFAHTDDDIDNILSAARCVLARFDFRPVTQGTAA
ncbi:MAG: aminotransferase class III-fold pyridoxal phosphate-dependent enzyme [Micropepsaceae bacterium]